jgi:hypothetical protein
MMMNTTGEKMSTTGLLLVWKEDDKEPPVFIPSSHVRKLGERRRLPIFTPPQRSPQNIVQQCYEAARL